MWRPPTLTRERAPNHNPFQENRSWLPRILAAGRGAVAARAAIVRELIRCPIFAYGRSSAVSQMPLPLSRLHIVPWIR